MTQAPVALPTIPADVRERIIATANELFEQSGRATMPTVDTVRRQARVDMNAASAVMREWRRAQTAQAAPVAVSVPEVVQQASSAAVAAIWQQAQELANESLRNAQAAWETERAELDGMRAELAEAFERQAGELDAAGKALAAAHADAEQQAQELAATRQQLAEAISRADKAEARITEIEHRAADLRAELDRAHADADRLRAEQVEAQKKAASEIETAHATTEATRAELVKVQAKAEAQAEAQAEAHAEQRKQAAQEAHRAAERLTKTQTERDEAQKATAEARERAAGLAGQLEAVQQQNAALLAAFKQESDGSGKGKR
ncbi:DNA-binding protein [Ralstonia nicotianae]